jgi:hypothetical protein
MSSDFVSNFVAKHGIDLNNNSFLQNPELLADFFEGVLASVGKTVKVSIGPEVMRVIGSGIQMETSLYSQMVIFGQNIQTAEEMTMLLQKFGEAFVRNMTPTFERSAIWLAFMSREQVDEMNREFTSLKDGSERPADEMPIIYRQTAELFVSPVIESSAGLLAMTERMCRTLGISRNDPFDIGLENLRAALEGGRFSVEDKGDGLFAVHSVTPPGSGLFLLPEFWNEQQKTLGAAPVVRIIHGDTVVFASSNKRPPAMVYRTEQGRMINPISAAILRWDGGEFVKERSAA